MSRTRFAVAACSFLAVIIATGLMAADATPMYAQVSAPAATDAPRKQINKVYPEYPNDALDRGIKGVVVVDITVNPAGDVTTAEVASGPQELRASAFTTALGLKFTPGSSTTAMKISVDYTLTGNSWGVRIWDSTTDGTRSGPIVYSMRGPENPMPAAARVGGAIRAPRKIKDAPPVYPAEAMEARVQGVVIIEARVDENGNISHTHVLRSVPLLDQAAIDSVKQWQYEPTVLNGSPIPVIMTVTVNFSLGEPSRPQVQLEVVVPEAIRIDGSATVRPSPVRPNDIALVFAKDKMAFGFVPLLDPSPANGTPLKVAIYRMNPNVSAEQPARKPGQTFGDMVVENARASGPPQLLGTVEVAPGGGIVYSQTTPSFGIQVLSIEQP